MGVFEIRQHLTNRKAVQLIAVSVAAYVVSSMNEEVWTGTPSIQQLLASPLRSDAKSLLW